MKKFLLLILSFAFFASQSIAQEPTKSAPKIPLYGLNSANYRTSEGAIRHFFEKVIKSEYFLDVDFGDKPCKSFSFKERTLEQSLKLMEVIFNVTIEKINQENKTFYVVKSKK